jgi:hypothetical protein
LAEHDAELPPTALFRHTHAAVAIEVASEVGALDVGKLAARRKFNTAISYTRT